MSSFSRALFRLLLGSRLPVTSGTLEVEGPRGPVTLSRDRHGIPMIEAEDELDVFFGFGFCQGQDRAVQIELMKRAASGTLSELFGGGRCRWTAFTGASDCAAPLRSSFRCWRPALLP